VAGGGIQAGRQLVAEYCDLPYRRAAVDRPSDGPREIARQAYAIGIWLLLASVLIQVMLAGLGIFANAAFFFWHVNVNGAVVFFLPLVLVGIGWYGRVPRRMLLLTAAISGLVIVQSLLLIPYRMQAPGLLRAVAGLHAVNALFIFWVAVRLLERVREPARPRA
jgi:hypothetical protein